MTAVGVGSQPPPLTGVRSAGESNVGKVRTSNEDSLIVDPIRGLYVVLDGMGGANAGDVASQTARDAIRDFVIEHRGKQEPKALLDAAINRGSQAVFDAAAAVRERHGMGTTCVACLMIDAKRAVIGHVGDSRAYLLRNGRLMALTRDHTIVEELVDRGLLAAEEAERHPYKNVLSRNLGAKPDAKVDLVEVEIRPGDRVMLCSDGLYGYATAEGIQYLLGSGDDPQHVAHDLIELALRGGGGDNVTAIVIEAPPAPPSTTQVVRTSGAIAWWQKRARFRQIAEERGVTRNPICRGLAKDEAVELIAMSLCEAVFHDLEKSTGVNVWTFTQNVAGGWFARGGEWKALRDLFEILGSAARAVVNDINRADAALGVLMDVAVGRALVVAELALGGLLSERLGQVDAQLVQAQANQPPLPGDSPRRDSDEQLRGPTGAHDAPTIDATIVTTRIGTDPAADLDSISIDTPATDPAANPTVADAATIDVATSTDLLALPPLLPPVDSVPPPGPSPSPSPEPSIDGFVEQATMPFLRADRGATVPELDAELVAALGKAITVARARTSPRAELVKQILVAIDQIALEGEAGLVAAAQAAARDIYGVRPVDDTGVMPLFDALDQARLITAASVHQITATDALRAKVLRAISRAHQRLVGATTALVLEASRPYSDRLREAQGQTSELRGEVERNERKRAQLETKLAQSVDQSQPWAKRGETEW